MATRPAPRLSGCRSCRSSPKAARSARSWKRRSPRWGCRSTRLRLDFAEPRLTILPVNIALKPEPRLSLPAEWYHQADIFERERQLIGPLSALANPGDYIATEITGWRVFVIKDREGGLRSFHNLCRHRAGHFLDDGQGHCDVLRCKYHGWVYDTKGNLRATPAFGEAGWFDKKDYPLKPIKVATWREGC